MSKWQGQAMGSRRKDLPSNQKSRERVRFTPNDIVRAIAGVEAAGLAIAIVLFAIGMTMSMLHLI